MTALCCINVASLLAANASTREHSHRALWKYSTESVCVCCVVLCFVLLSCVTWSAWLSFSISRMISLTWAPQGLVILVISSTCRSIVAASGRPNNAEKRRTTTVLISPVHDKIGPRKLAINKPMSGVRYLLEHLKWMRRDVLKNRETETSYIYICMKSTSMNLEVTVAGIFFSFQANLQSGKQSRQGKLTGEPLHTGLTD